MRNQATEHDLEERQFKRLTMAAHFSAAMISSIHSDEDYQRVKHLAINHGCGKVSSWITKEAWKQAENLLLHNEAICARELKNSKGQ